MVNFAKTISDEWADDGILVNVINPWGMVAPVRLKAFEEKPVVTLLSPGIVSKKIDFDNFTKEKIFQIAWRSYFRKISHKKFGKWKICFQLN